MSGRRLRAERGGLQHRLTARNPGPRGTATSSPLAAAERDGQNERVPKRAHRVGDAEHGCLPANEAEPLGAGGRIDRQASQLEALGRKPNPVN